MSASDLLKPMLAKDFTRRHFLQHGFLQPKHDGVRWFWNGREAYSRNLKPLHGCPLLLEALQDLFGGQPLDGELYIHGQSFESYVGDIKRDHRKPRKDGKTENLKIGYFVYDVPSNRPFWERQQALVELVRDQHPRIHAVKSTPIERTEDHYLLSEEDLKTQLDVFVSDGYEGTMWRAREGSYEYGRRTDALLKIKGWKDAEFKVVGIEELVTHEKLLVEPGTPGAKPYSDRGDNAGLWYKDGEGTAMGTCGALIVEMPDGQTVNVGSGLSDVTRELFWSEPPIGKMATVKYLGITDKGVLRHPIFKAIRDYE